MNLLTTDHFLQFTRRRFVDRISKHIILPCQLSFLPDATIFAGSLEAAYSLNWGAREIWGKGGGETLALL